MLQMKKILIVLVLGILATSCQKSTTNTETQETQAFQAQRDAFFNNLMAPAEVAAQIQFSAAEFNPALMSNPGNFSQYTGNPVKAAANMGVYLSDLNYSIAYRQSATTKQHFDAAYELSKAIGVDKEILGF